MSDENPGTVRDGGNGMGVWLRMGKRPWIITIGVPVLVAFWPCLFFFRMMIPIDGMFTEIGNDFGGLYYTYKLYLLAHLADFDFPLWSPSEGAGYPFFSSPFTQAFYPLNLLLLIWYKISGGYHRLDHQLFTILGISIFALGLYFWLLQLCRNRRAVLFAVLVVPVSFKMTEIIRFPNAVHTAAWYPWILLAITKIMLSESRSGRLRWGCALAVFTVCLLTGGYPYFVYYAQFLIVPYLLFLLIPPLRRKCFHDRMKHVKTGLLWILASCTAALTVCLPYLVSIKNLMAQTTDRTGRDWQFSTLHEFSLQDTLGSLLYPPGAQAEGWYFFSITALLVAGLYLFHVCAGMLPDKNLVRREKVAPGFVAENEVWLAAFLIAWMGIISWVTYGGQSPLFKLLWHVYPGFSSLRVWGRLNIVLLPVIAWFLTLSYAFLDNHLISSAPEERKSSWKRYRYVFVAIILYAATLSVQLVFHLNSIHDSYWKTYFTAYAGREGRFLYTGFAGFACLAGILAASAWKRTNGAKWRNFFLFSLVCTAVFEFSSVGRRQWSYSQTYVNDRREYDISEIYSRSLSVPRIFGYTASMSTQYSVGLIENWFFQRYVSFLKRTEDQKSDADYLLGTVDGTRFFFSESITYSSIRGFLGDAALFQGTLNVQKYSGDELILQVDCPLDGYISFIDNWDPSWRVWVDGNPEKIDLLFGTFKSVAVRQGVHRVRFKYCPGIFEEFENIFTNEKPPG